MGATKTTTLNLVCLGAFDASLDNHITLNLRTDKIRALLVYLALESRPHRREVLAGMFWPELSDTAAATNLRTSLYRLRQPIEEVAPELAKAIFSANRQTVTLNVALCSSDVQQFETLLETCKAHEHLDLAHCEACLARLTQAVALYQDDLLIGFHVDEAPAFEEWLTVRRERLRQQLQETLHQLALAHEHRSDDMAQEYARRLLRLEPWREDAHRLLMRAAVRQGQTNLALAQYQICRQVLASELGIEPDAETVALFEQIRNGALKQAELASAAISSRKAVSAGSLTHSTAISTSRLSPAIPTSLTLNIPLSPLVQSQPQPFPTPSPSSTHHNLPIMFSGLVGRTEERARIKQLLDTNRLVTLTGPGGIGKTRLSVEIARTLLDQYADGIWQIELGLLTDSDRVVPTVAAALGLRETQTPQTDEALVSYLRSKSLLLILDNCEHVLKACAVLVERILRVCPRVQILATSREVLHLNGESVFVLQPLPLPSAIAEISANTITEALRYDAIRLFVERVRSVQPYFELTAQNIASVLQICRQLDGIPLALELAAARTRTLSLEEMVPRLDNRLTLLNATHTSNNPRHQTLRATIDWGYELLSAQEQRLFRQLAVFSGSFTLAAVEYLTSTTIDETTALPIVDALGSLVDKSFVLIDHANDGIGGTTGRYCLLETMRLYALEQLAQSADEGWARTRHLDFYTQVADEAMSHSRGPDMPKWFRRLDADHDNLRAALTWALDPVHGNPLAAMRLAGVMARYWEVRGHLSEAQNALNQIFALNPPLRLAARSSSADSGTNPVSLDDATTRQTAQWRARALMRLFFVPRFLSELERAKQFLFEALALYQALHDKFNIAQTYNSLGVIFDDQADYIEARRCYETSHTMYRELGNHWGIALTLNNLASISVAQGDGPAAWPLIQESVVLMRSVGDPSRLANVLGTLAQTCQEIGNFDLARQALNEAASIHNDLGDQMRKAELLNDMGDFESRQRRYTEARRLYLESIAIFQKLWDRRRIANGLEGLGRTLVALGDLTRAVRLFSNTDTLRLTIGAPMSPAQKLARDAALTTAEHILGQVNFAKAWSAGRTLSLEQAIVDAGNVQSPFSALPDLSATTDNALSTQLATQGRYDWGEMPAIEVFHGRSSELVQLQGWLLQDQCRFVSILGLGGIGKTTLAAATAKAVAPAFDVVIWRSLLNAPQPVEMVHGWLQVLSQHTLSAMPESFDATVRLLLDYLRQQRCLLVLDNCESLLRASAADTQSVGVLQAGYEGYAQLFERLATSEHKSCIVLTSREQPYALLRIGRESRSVRQLPLGGLDLQAGSAILQGSGLAASAQDAALLVKQYSGNPLALQIVANTITDLFGGDVAFFQREGGLVFDGIRAILDQQFERLSNLEREILIWLAIEREAVSAQELRQNLIDSVSMAAFLGALGALQARSLLERTDEGLTLQNVVIEYLTERLIDDVCAEIGAGAILGKEARLHRHALLKAQAKDYIRQSQTLLILGGIVTRMGTRLGQANLIQRLRRMLADLRQHHLHQPTYAAGNLINLLLSLDVELDHCDLSDLYVWQAYLRTAKLQNVNLAGADLKGTVFADTFATITVLVYSHDGQYVAGATSIGDIRVWLASTMQPVGSLQGHSRIVMGMAFSASDSQLLVSGGEDGTVRTWNLADLARPSAVLYRAQGFVRAIAISPITDLVAIAGDELDIQIWDMRSRRAVAVLRGHTNIITSLAFTPDGKHLASCSGDHTVRMWPVETIYNAPAYNAPHILENSKAIYTWPPEIEDVWMIAISPNGQLLAGVNRDGKTWTWQIDEALSDKPIQVLREKEIHHTSLAFSPDSTALAVGAESRLIWLLDVRTGKTLRQLEGHRQLTAALAYAPDGQTLISSGGDRILKVWELQTSRLVQAIAGAARTVRCVAYARDGRAVISCGADRVTRIWEMRETMDASGGVQLAGECRHVLQGGHTSGIWAVAIDHASQVVASAGEDHNICLWDRSTGRLLHTLQGHSYTVTAIDFSVDGRTLASASPDQTVRLWDYHSGALLATLTTNNPSHSVHEQSIWCVAVSPDGGRVAAGYSDGSIALWDIRDMQHCTLLREFRRHAGWVRHLAFSPDGRTLASCSNDQTLRLWDLATGAVLGECLGHSDWVMWVAFHPDGETLASASFDGTVRVWNAATGQPVAPTGMNPLMRHSKGVVALAYHPKGHVLVSASWEERLKFWDAHTQAQLHTLIAPGPYSGMNIAGVTGVSEAQRAALRALGAVD